jgi:peptide/nickel transport system substrate-binding protein
MATDRERLRQSVLGDLAKVPPGPMPEMWWLWSIDARPLSHDSARAARLLDQRGWRDTDGDGVRDKGGVKFSFHLTAPTTSAIRRRYAQLLQAQYRPFGVEVQIDEVENPVLVERAQAGRFDAALASWQSDPTPTSSFPQTWTAEGFGGTNWGRYAQPAFEQLLNRAVAASPQQSRQLWQSTLRLLNEDAPGVWLYAIGNVAAIHARVADVQIRPDSWWSLVRTWRIPPDQLIDRDRAER